MMASSVKMTVHFTMQHGMCNEAAMVKNLMTAPSGPDGWATVIERWPVC